MDADPRSENLDDETSTGLDAQLSAALSYLLGPVTGIAFLLLEKRSSFVRFHAMQSTITFIGLGIIDFAANYVPLLGGLISALVGPVGVVLWILLMFKAFQGERYRLPVVGDAAEERIGGSLPSGFA